MVTTMIPIGDGKRIFGVSERLPAFTLSAIVGGALLVSVATMVGRGIFNTATGDSTTAATPLGLAALLYAADAARVVRVPLPRSTWQVPAGWEAFRPRVLPAVAYGLVLGAGIFTRGSAAFVVALLWCVCFATPGQAAVVGGTFGGSRAVTLWLFHAAVGGNVSVHHPAVVLGAWDRMMRASTALALLLASGIWLLS